MLIYSTLEKLLSKSFQLLPKLVLPKHFYEQLSIGQVVEFGGMSIFKNVKKV